MKLFGKRKKASEDGIQSNPSTPAKADEQQNQEQKQKQKKQQEQEEQVSSYFSAGFVPPSQTDKDGKGKLSNKDEKKEHDIDELLAMDHKELNAKQRRVLKRYHERGSATTDTDAATDAIDIDTATATATDTDTTTDTTMDTTTAAISKEKEDKPKEEESETVNKKEESTGMTIDSTTPKSTTIEEGAVTAPVEIPKEEQEQKIEEEKVQEAVPAPAPVPAPKELLSIEAIAEQLRAVNSKERRKLLRALAVDYDADFLNKATEASKLVVVVPVVDADPVVVDAAPVDEKVQEVANQLKGLNSKERRKLLRQLASQYDEAFLQQVTDASKKIAEENEAKQVQEQEKSATADSGAGSGKRKAGEMTGADAKGGKKKSAKLKDLSHLPPDERARREKQREMQQEAAQRRAAGDVLTRHPLNSERRRANRRKPGRAGKIAQMKKETKERHQGTSSFNASGYTMRHVKKGDSGY